MYLTIPKFDSKIVKTLKVSWFFFDKSNIILLPYIIPLVTKIKSYLCIISAKRSGVGSLFNLEFQENSFPMAPECISKKCQRNERVVFHSLLSHFRPYTLHNWIGKSCWSTARWCSEALLGSVFFYTQLAQLPTAFSFSLSISFLFKWRVELSVNAWR